MHTQLEIISRRGDENLAFVYVARTGDERNGYIEFVESLQPPLPREKKWVLIVRLKNWAKKPLLRLELPDYT